jgi:hypothetical protein
MKDEKAQVLIAVRKWACWKYNTVLLGKNLFFTYQSLDYFLDGLYYGFD